MRDRYKKKKHYPAIAEEVGRSYDKLIALCCHGRSTYYNSRSIDDVFQDTVVYIVSDREALDKTDNDFINHFLHRFRMVEYQTMQDARELKAKQHANHIQTQEEAAEPWQQV